MIATIFFIWLFFGLLYWACRSFPYILAAPFALGALFKEHWETGSRFWKFSFLFFVTAFAFLLTVLLIPDAPRG